MNLLSKSNFDTHGNNSKQKLWNLEKNPAFHFKAQYIRK